MWALIAIGLAAVLAVGVFYLLSGAKRACRRPRPAPSIDEIAAELEASRGVADRPPALPAWVLSLRSPFEDHPVATSWIGGLPKAPTAFDWPRDEAGKALHFAAQIDLADLRPRAGPDLDRPALPQDGALLAFFGWTERPLARAIVLLSGDDMGQAVDVAPPSDLAPLREIGFWTGPTVVAFPKWPVDLVPYDDHESAVPPGTIAEDDPAARLDHHLGTGRL